MAVVFTKIAVIFIMVLIGYVASKAKVLPYESNKYLVSLLLAITTPCMILSSMTAKTLTAKTLQESIEVIVGSIVFFLVAAALAYVVVRLLNYQPKSDQGILMVIMTAVNTGFMGFPITKAIFGDEYLFLMVIENIVLTTYLYSLAVFQMNIGEKKATDLKTVFRPLCNMCMLATVIAIALLLLGIKLPGPIMDLTTTIGDATIPISMIVVGIQLAESNLAKVIRNGRLILISLCNVILMPALTFLAVNWLPITDPAKLILIYAAAFPCAVVTVAVATKENKNAGLMAEGVALTTLFSLITLPIISMVLLTLYI